MIYLQCLQKTKIQIKYRQDLQTGWLKPRILKLEIYMIPIISVMSL